jgi:hypothetical protein
MTHVWMRRRVRSRGDLRTTMLERRCKVMTGWAAFPAGAGAESKVVPLKGRQ